MKTETSLYDLTNEMNRIDNILEETGGELTPEMEGEIMEMRTRVLSKVDGCVGYHTYLKDVIQRIKDKKNKLSSLQKTCEKKVEWFRGYLIQCLENNGAKSIESEFSRMTLGKETEDFEVDRKVLPAQYMREKVVKTLVLDLAKIKHDLNEGISIPGITRIRKKTLRITTRGKK